MFNRPLNSFVPSVYRDIVEMDSIINSEENIMDIVRHEMSSAFANTFVLTSDESGVIMFESMLGILANTQTEDLEFRRQRILNRLSMNPPFTFRFLKQKLDEIIGVDAWSAYVDFENYTLYVESSAVNQAWYHEVEFTVNRVKPCNIVFINVPLVARALNMSEEISYTTKKWWYRLGTWQLSENPFAGEGAEGGMIKMPDIKSIQQALLNDAATFVASDVSYVVLNDTVEIREFRTKQSEGNLVTLEYVVTPGMTSLITSIKLMSANDAVLSQASVYVPVTNTVVSKHTITVKEGA